MCCSSLCYGGVDICGFLRVLHDPYSLAPLASVGGFLLVGDVDDCVSHWAPWDFCVCRRARTFRMVSLSSLWLLDVVVSICYGGVDLCGCFSESCITHTCWLSWRLWEIVLWLGHDGIVEVHSLPRKFYIYRRIRTFQRVDISCSVLFLVTVQMW